MHWPGSGRNRVEEAGNNRNGIVRREKLADAAVFIPLCLFLVSPLIQIVREIIAPHKETAVFGPIRTYPDTIELIQMFVLAATVIGWTVLIVNLVKRIRGKEKVSLFIPFVLFAALSVWLYTSQSVNGFTDYAYDGEPYRKESLMTFVLYLMGYFFLGTVLKSARLRKAAVLVFLAANFAVGVLTLVDHYAVSLSFIGDSNTDGLSAVFHQFNHYGYYLVFGILLSAMLFVTAGEKLWLRVCCAIIYLVDTYILILNNTFGCFLAVAAALLFGAIVLVVTRKNRSEKLRMLAVLLAFVAVTLGMRVFGISNSKDITNLVKDVGEIASDSEQAASAGTGRWALWKHTVEYISEKPVFGWGVDGTTVRLGNEADTINDRPHNEYLQWAAFFGIPAALLYLAALCVIMFGMFPRIGKADIISLACFIASAGYIASAFFGNTMYYTAPFFFIFLGMTCRDRFYQKLTGTKDQEDAAIELSAEQAEK